MPLSVSWRPPCRSPWVAGVLLSLTLLASSARAQSGVSLNAQSAALHVINRLSFGPAPGDLARVMQMGVDAYIDEQLHPERLPLSAPLGQQLKALHTTQLSAATLIVNYREAEKAVRRDPANGRQERREMVRQVEEEAGEARLLQALTSPRQLQEVMVDFWFNHFNVYSGKGLDRVLIGSYEADAIRPYVMGNFRDLLGATAHHPAMLFYLDNWLSAAPGYQASRRATPAKSSGLNENYAREIMELHTLGVDGGYSQTDVTELARMLTGWTIDPRRGRGESAFYYEYARHDQGSKQWLGRNVASAGQAEGDLALDVLAAAPATAHHIAFQLAQYFVSDTPPAALVNQLAQRFQETHGDIRAVLQTLFSSAEFRAPAVYLQKFKSPYRYVLSTLRASSVPVHNVRPLRNTLRQLGMPLYGCQTPDGYKNTEAAWLSPDAITRRVNFAVALASGKLPLARAMADGDAELASADGDVTTPPVDAAALLGTLPGALSSDTLTVVNQSAPRLRAALILGSPDFMHY